MESATAAQGLVTGLEEGSGGEGGTVYRPIVQFTTAEGQVATFTESVGSSPPRYSVGQTVRVVYPPGNPSGARIPSWFGLWFIPAFAALFAVILIPLGAFLYFSGPDLGAPEPPSVVTIPSNVPLPPELASPGVLPTSIPTSGSVLVIQSGSGIPSPVQVTCDSVRDRGKSREVRMSYQGGHLVFKASPYTGPGAYTPGSNLEVAITIFEGVNDLTGAVLFDQSGQAGAINLVAGDRIVTGSWDCKSVKVS
jgi:uncharacterized protein DUF3592